MGTGAAKANLWWHRVKSGFGEVEALALESGFVTFPPAVLLGTPAGGHTSMEEQWWDCPRYPGFSAKPGEPGVARGTEAGPGIFRSQHALGH